MVRWFNCTRRFNSSFLTMNPYFPPGFDYQDMVEKGIEEDPNETPELKFFNQQLTRLKQQGEKIDVAIETKQKMIGKMKEVIKSLQKYAR